MICPLAAALISSVNVSCSLLGPVPTSLAVTLEKIEIIEVRGQGQEEDAM